MVRSGRLLRISLVVGALIGLTLSACRNPHRSTVYNPAARPVGRPLLKRLDDVPDRVETQLGRLDSRLERILY